MTVTLAALVADLQADVPARNGVPTAEQYQVLVKRAVRDYSRRRPLEKVMTLDIVNGQAEYTLPADFLFLIRLESPWVGEGVIHSADGLIPVPEGYRERYTITGRTLTFYPAPTYSATWNLRYGAGHVLDESDAYPDMTDEDAYIALLKAQALALRLQAQNAAISGEMTEYQIGDERVRRVPAAEALGEKADAGEAAYEAAVRAAVGPTGTRARYEWWEVAR